MWNWTDTSPLWMMAGLAAIFALLLFWRQVKWVLRLLLRTGIGGILLALFSPVGELFGISLGVNLINALVLGALGLPGLGLLLGLSWLTG